MSTAVLAAGAATAGLLLRSRAAAAPPTREPEPEPAVAPPPDLAEAYRAARRAFNHAAEEPGDAAFEDLRAATTALWVAATVAEPRSASEARALARGARRILDALAERRDLELVPAQAAAHVTHRREQLEAKIAERGHKLFASKPGRVARRVADDSAD
ncbi:MAG: CHAD domain-containing protein [Solirubrobacteraceae bacterium]